LHELLLTKYNATEGTDDNTSIEVRWGKWLIHYVHYSNTVSMTSPCHTDDKKSQAHLKEEQKKTEGSTTQDGFVPIFFADGTSDRVKLLIPADGVYSTVQAKLEDDQHSNVKNHDKIYCSLNAPPPSTLQYIGIMLINGITLGFHHPLLDERGKMSKTKTVSLKTQSRRIVVLGDAMHAMSPFKGQGANQALSDGPLLVDWLCRKGAILTDALSHFEREMIHRTRNKVIAYLIRSSRKELQKMVIMTSERNGR
jgi:2-polyprenyl-6-methoxyphenol hydroxylase-like FAD-dependent oxidoreductase